MLSPYRVLDLTDERAALGPMMLADLGAEVILIEPPGGSPARHAPPLSDGDAGAATVGLPFQAYNRNKRSITLDLAAEQGRADFFALVRSAHFLFENAVPGTMAARGLGYADLRAVNPGLIYVAITPFGQDGPYAQHAATDLTLAAMGGMVAVNGEADRPPVRVSVPQTWRHAAAESAVAALVAHFRRLQSGEGQFVDVSVQAATFWTTLNASIAAAIQGKDFERNGTALQVSTITMQTMYPCTDGSIVVFMNPQSLRVVVRWMVEEEVVPPSWLEDEDWSTFDVRLLTGEPVAHSLEELSDRIAAYTARYSKADLFRRGHAEGMFLAPSNSVADVLAFEHLDARDYWQTQPLPDGRVIKRPGPFVRATGVPIQYRREAPEPGADTADLLAEVRTAAQPEEVTR
jgi:crotonobetainyl-CoA:carnitine CoA-transferase CaiB-like acyl-CoA transferase